MYIELAIRANIRKRKTFLIVIDSRLKTNPEYPIKSIMFNIITQNYLHQFICIFIRNIYFYTDFLK